MHSLRQRRSRSPIPSHKHGSAASSGDEAELLIGKGSRSTTRITNAENTRQIPTILLRLALLVIFVGLAIFAYWLSLLLGFYNPDAATCSVPTFEYPWCEPMLMHAGTLANEKEPLILTFDEWLDLRQRFQKAVVEGGHGAFSSLADDWQEANTVGFVDPRGIEIKNSAGKGRGVFATRTFPKGTKIWDSRYRGVFPNECSAKHFFNTLTDQQKCDAIFWGYINNFYGNGIQYMLDLDGHGYINHGDDPNAVHQFEGELDTTDYSLSRIHFPSLGIFPLNRDTWKARNRPGAYGLYAKRDIVEGEEILYDYDEIFVYAFFDWFTVYVCRSLPIWEWFTI